MRKAWLVVLLSLFTVLTAFGGSGIGQTSGFMRDAMDATFALYGQNVTPNGTVRHFLCTATAIAKSKAGYTLLTAGHCAYDEPPEVTFVVSEQIGSAVFPVKPLTARLEGQEDLMLLFLPSTKKYPVMKLGDESSESIGDDEINVNFTAGLGKQLALGKIASQEMGDVPRCDYCGGKFLFQAEAAGGASGSAVISGKTQRVVGIDIISTEGGIGVEPISTIKAAMLKPSQFVDIHKVQDDDDQ